MRHYLENNKLKIEIDSFGAELKSVVNKNDYREYMWYGNPKFWGRTSPVLFPFVGSLKNKQYLWQGKEYPMGQHGFARDFEHELLSKNDYSMEFSFKSTEVTRARYPFDFELRCGYELKENELKVSWKVFNTSADLKSGPMYFSIGAHPAFLCPIHGESDKTDYRLCFDGCDEIKYHGNIVSTGMALMEEKTMKLENSRVRLTSDFFDECTYFIEGAQTGLVGLEDPSGHRIVDVIFDTPLFAIWSPEGKNAPFLCIEPWYGRCDADDFDGALEERAYTNTCKPGECFEASYTLRFHDVTDGRGDSGAGQGNLTDAVTKESDETAACGTEIPADFPERLRSQMAFALELDKEKNIFRQTSLSDHGRKENDAEHAWHMAIMSYLLKEYANEPVDIAKTMLMCLIHDVVEIDAGDTYAYDEEGKKSQKARENAAKERIFSLLPDDQKEVMVKLFDEFEERVTPEARFARAMDNLQPLMLNNSNGGSDWKEHGVDASKVYARQSQTKDGSETLYELTDALIQQNIRRGSLKP